MAADVEPLCAVCRKRFATRGRFCSYACEDEARRIEDDERYADLGDEDESNAD